MSAITPYNFEGLTVRTVMVDGEPHFVGKDVADALGYVDATTAIRSHCKGVQKLHPLPTAGGAQNVRVLAEPDVLRLIVGSTLPAAVRFERWVFEDVLPSIRRTGSYGVASPVPQTFAQALRLAADLEEQKALAIAERDQAIATKAQIGSRREASAMASASAAHRRADSLQRELGRHHQHATVLAVENALSEAFAWRPLKVWCDANGATCHSVPDARYGSVKAWPAAAWLAVYRVRLDALFPAPVVGAAA